MTPTTDTKPEHSPIPKPAGHEAALHDAEDAAEELVSSVFRVGRLWASHGLSIADRTLQAAAESLEVTARTLQGLSKRFDSDEQ